jgi:hypothetical protein
MTKQSCKKTNEIDENLSFKISTESNNSISFLDLLVHRNGKNIEIAIYRKPTETGTLIHYSSNHPLEHKKSSLSLLHKSYDNIAHNKTIQTGGMGNSNVYSKEQWLPNHRNPKPESENRKEKKNNNNETFKMKQQNQSRNGQSSHITAH